MVVLSKITEFRLEFCLVSEARGSCNVHPDDQPAVSTRRARDLFADRAGARLGARQRRGDETPHAPGAAKNFIPIHGELRHLNQHAAIARDWGNPGGEHRRCGKRITRSSSEGGTLAGVRPHPRGIRVRGRQRGGRHRPGGDARTRAIGPRRIRHRPVGSRPERAVWLRARTSLRAGLSLFRKPASCSPPPRKRSGSGRPRKRETGCPSGSNRRYRNFFIRKPSARPMIFVIVNPALALLKSS